MKRRNARPSLAFLGYQKRLFECEGKNKVSVFTGLFVFYLISIALWGALHFFLRFDFRIYWIGVGILLIIYLQVDFVNG
jgi:hypothetical protein